MFNNKEFILNSYLRRAGSVFKEFPAENRKYLNKFPMARFGTVLAILLVLLSGIFFFLESSSQNPQTAQAKSFEINK